MDGKFRRLIVKDNNFNNGGVGILTVVQINFLILKLANLINWSWWTVLIPLWISIGVICGEVLFYTLLTKKNKETK